jgi:16S rRNA U516 pseudouridylate synthase RsuA-like enzyme
MSKDPTMVGLAEVLEVTGRWSQDEAACLIRGGRVLVDGVRVTTEDRIDLNDGLKEVEVVSLDFGMMIGRSA